MITLTLALNWETRLEKGARRMLRELPGFRARPRSRLEITRCAALDPGRPAHHAGYRQFQGQALQG